MSANSQQTKSRKVDAILVIQEGLEEHIFGKTTWSHFPSTSPQAEPGMAKGQTMESHAQNRGTTCSKKHPQTQAS